MKIFALIFPFLLSACSALVDTNMRLFVLGKWIGESSPNTNVQYVLKFLPFDLLLADIKTPDEKAHNILFTYHFKNQTQIIIEGRFIEELQITKRKNNVVTIHSLYGFIPDGDYKKDPCIDVYFLSILTLIILLLSISRHLKTRKSKLKYEASKVA